MQLSRNMVLLYSGCTNIRKLYNPKQGSNYYCRWSKHSFTSQDKENRGNKKIYMSKMFVIGISGVTCGGKTTLTHLVQKSFPWCQVIHQDNYFYDDDDPHHIQAEGLNHVNYEILTALDMERMQSDVQKVLTQENLTGSPHDQQNEYVAPNFEAAGKELLENVKDIDVDTTKYRNVPILLLEGYTIFGSELLYGKCDARFFLTLTEQECYERRCVRTTYIPADVPGYFEKCIWPEYFKHFEKFINKNPGIHIFDGTTPIESIWKQSVEIIGAEIEKKFSHLVL